MIPSQNCINLIKNFEGLSLNAYLCPASVCTIGYGTTRYEDGKKVQMGEKISIERAEKLLNWEVSKIAYRLPEMRLNQNQFDSIVSFTYNLGYANFVHSTLYNKIIRNPNDQLIKDEFMKWCNARVNGKMVKLKGLIRRREAETNLYFK